MGNRQTNKQSYRIRASTTENLSDSDEGGDEITLNPRYFLAIFYANRQNLSPVEPA